MTRLLRDFGALLFGIGLGGFVGTLPLLVGGAFVPCLGAVALGAAVVSRRRFGLALGWVKSPS